MDFDEARRASEEMLGQPEDGSQAPPVGDDGGEAADISDIPPEVQNQQPPEDSTPKASVQPEQQVNPPEQQNLQLQQQLEALQQQNAQFQQQNTQLQGMVRELSDQNKQHLVEQAVEMPRLDISSLTFADEEEIARAQSQYANDMRDFVISGLKDDPNIKSLLEEAERGRMERQKQEMFKGFDTVEQLNGFRDNLPFIESFIERNQDVFAKDAPLDAKYIIAKAVVDGVNAQNNAGHQPTVEEMMAMYNNSPEFQNAIEQQRIAAIKNSQQVPPMSASSGAVNAALNIENKPKSFDEASELAKKILGGI